MDKTGYLLNLLPLQNERTDSDFAKVIGISRQTWQGIRTRTQPISDNVIIKSALAFPDTLWIAASVTLLNEPPFHINIMRKKHDPLAAYGIPSRRWYSLLWNKLRRTAHVTYQKVQGKSLDQYEGSGNS